MDFSSPSNCNYIFTRAGSSSDINDDSPNSNNVSVTPAGVSKVRVYVEDKHNIEPDKVMPYMFLLARGIHEEIPHNIDISSVDCLEKGLELKLLKKKAIVVTKPLVIQELKRRDETIKLNGSNKKLEELFSLLVVDDLDELDKDYIIEVVSGYLRDISRAVEETENKRKESTRRMDMKARLCWIMAIDNFGDIRHAYMRLQDVLSREELDAHNSEAGCPI